MASGKSEVERLRTECAERKALMATVGPLLPPMDVAKFLRILGMLHLQAAGLDWKSDDAARINATALCAMIAEEIERANDGAEVRRGAP